MDELKKVIDLPALSDVEISKKGISLATLWMVKDSNDNIFGPYDTEALKVYIARYEYLFTKTKTYNMESEQWHDTFEISYFQRRQKNHQGTNPNLATNDFYIYLNNQQAGPYTKDEIQNFLNNGQIKSNSELSIDKGQTWIKVFEHHAFDRRIQKTNQELPFRPAQELLNKMALTKEDIIKAKQADDAIAELAYLGHHKSTMKSSTKGQYEMNEVEGKSKKEKSPMKKSTKIFITATACGIFALAFGLNFLSEFSNNTNNLSNFSNEKLSATKEVVHTPIQEKTNLEESPQRVTPKAVSIKPRIFPTRAKKRVVLRDKVEPKERKIDRDDRYDNREEIDVNDPELQEEITRALAAEEPIEEDIPFIDERAVEEEMPEMPYETSTTEEDPVSHTEEDY